MAHDVNQSSLIAQLPPLIDEPKLRELLCCGDRYVYELVKSGRLPASRIGRKLLFKTSDVLALLDAQPARTDDGEATTFRARGKRAARG